MDNLKPAVDKLDARTYEMRGDVQAIYRRVDEIEKRVREMHTWMKEMRTRYADEGQVFKILDAVKGVQRSIDKLR